MECGGGKVKTELEIPHKFEQAEKFLSTGNEANAVSYVEVMEKTKSRFRKFM